MNLKKIKNLTLILLITASYASCTENVSLEAKETEEFFEEPYETIIQTSYIFPEETEKNIETTTEYTIATKDEIVPIVTEDFSLQTEIGGTTISTLDENIEESIETQKGNSYEELPEELIEEKDSDVKYDIIMDIPEFSVVGITSEEVNFRAKPSLEADIIEVLSKGTSLYILDGMMDYDNFYHVTIDGYAGYIDKSLVIPKSKKLYAREDTSLILGEVEFALEEGKYITLYQTACNIDVDSSFNPIYDESMLVSYDEYIKEKIDNVELELVTAFSTNYSLEKLYEGKAFNIDHCCNNYIDGMIVASNESFNWFEDVGNTGKDEGYVLANVFSGGKTIKGYGGGVCQVSSTMYNCVLNLGLKVIERHAHGKPVYYVDYYSGKDASVSDVGGGFNFVWQNTRDYDIYIKAYTSIDEAQPLSTKGVLTIEFYKIIF